MTPGRAAHESEAAWLGSGGRLIARILRRNRAKVAAILLLTLGVYAFGTAVPIVMQNFIDGIIAQRDGTIIASLAVLALLMAAFDVVFADLRRSKAIELGQHLDRHIALEIMASLLSARIDVRSHDIGEILNRSEQVEKTKTFMIDVVPGSAFDIGGAAIAVAVIFFYSPLAGLSVLLVAAGAFVASRRVLLHYYDRVSDQFRKGSVKQGFLAETATGLATIKGLAMEPARRRLWSRIVRDLVRVAGQTEHILRRFFRVTRLSQHLLTFAVVGAGGIELLHGRLSVGELFAILLLANKVSSPLLGAADIARQYQEIVVAVRELGLLLDAPRERAEMPGRALPAIGGPVEFERVSYRYDPARPPAVSGISTRLPEQGLVAIIGRNGSGKSTLLKLMQGLLRDFDGRILIGGTDLRTQPPRGIRARMATVDQSTTLFAGTVRDNVTCWSPGVADAEVEEALRLTGAWAFVESLPDGVNTHLIENGANLSGGQRQRLSVARAVLRDPAIILLDEPTAFLDAEAATRLEQQLLLWGSGRLMVLVSHHLAATRLAETIILMDNGEIAAIGSHETLLECSALYRSLWNDYLRGTGIGHQT